MKTEIEWHRPSEEPTIDSRILVLTADAYLQDMVYFDQFDSWKDFLTFAGSHVPVIAWAYEPSYPSELWGKA